MPTLNSDGIVRCIFEPPPQRGFARHLLCAIGAISDQSDRSPLQGCDSRSLLRALAQWRWQLPTPAYHHEQLPRPLHLISSSPPRLRHHLEEHLLAATLDWSCDTFYDHSPRALAQDATIFNSLALLKIIQQCATSAQLFLVSPACPRMVYGLIGVKMFSSGVFSVATYRRFLQACNKRHLANINLPTSGSSNIAALLVLPPTRPLLTPNNPLNQCLTLCHDAAQIPQLLNNPPLPDDKHTHLWQSRNEHDIIDMAAELLN